jgi:hypothetical protein
VLLFLVQASHPLALLLLLLLLLLPLQTQLQVPTRAAAMIWKSAITISLGIQSLQPGLWLLDKWQEQLHQIRLTVNLSNLKLCCLRIQIICKSSDQTSNKKKSKSVFPMVASKKCQLQLVDFFLE